MSQSLIFNEKEYVPATIAGRYFGYTKEYLLMLIKGGKIDGQKIGHKWYVYIPSAENYFAHAQRERTARRRALSESRKTELDARSGLHGGSAPRELPVRGVWVALAETVAIMFLGVAFGSLGYVGATAPNFAEGVYAMLRGGDSVAAVARSIPEATPTLGVSGYVGTTTHTSLVIAPADLFTLTTVEDIEDSFSDPVHIELDPLNPRTGIVTPQFVSGAGGAYRFLMVPVNPIQP